MFLKDGGGGLVADSSNKSGQAKEKKSKKTNSVCVCGGGACITIHLELNFSLHFLFFNFNFYILPKNTYKKSCTNVAIIRSRVNFFFEVCHYKHFGET